MSSNAKTTGGFAPPPAVKRTGVPTSTSKKNKDEANPNGLVKNHASDYSSTYPVTTSYGEENIAHLRLKLFGTAKIPVKFPLDASLPSYRGGNRQPPIDIIFVHN